MIHTKIHSDEYFRSLSDREQCFFVFLLTNERVNLCGMYECPDWYVLSFKPKWDKKSLESMKDKFDAELKFLFKGDWVKIVNYEKYNHYLGEKNSKAYNNELNSVPEDFSRYCIDRVSIGYRYSYKHIYKNNNILEGESMRGETKQKGGTSDEEAKFLEQFNLIHSTKFKSSRSWRKNFAYWREVYSLDDLVLALRNAKNHPFWKDKLDPDKFLRTHEDRIGQLLNYSRSGKAEDKPIDPLITAAMGVK